MLSQKGMCPRGNGRVHGKVRGSSGKGVGLSAVWPGVSGNRRAEENPAQDLGEKRLGQSSRKKSDRKVEREKGLGYLDQTLVSLL